jgi:hypothetical protein
MSPDWAETLSVDVTDNATLLECDPSTRELYRLWIVSERVRDYAAGGGFNGIMLPANQGAFAWYDSAIYSPQLANSAFQLRQLPTLLSLLEPSELQLHVLFKPEMLLPVIERAMETEDGLLAKVTLDDTQEDSAASNDTPAPRAATRTRYNPLHPLVRQAIGELVRELNEQCASIPGFAGLVIECEGSSHLQPANVATDAGSVMLFAQGNHGPSDPSELREWMRQQGQPRLEAWVSSELQSAYQQVGQSASPVPAKLLTSVVSEPMGTGDPQATPTEQTESTPPPSVPTATRTQSPLENQYVRLYAFGPVGVLSKQSTLPQQIASGSGPISAILLSDDRGKNAVAVVRQQWTHELSRLIDRTDPRLVIVDHQLVANHLSDDLANTLQAFCALPNQRMQESQPVDSASHTVHVRSGSLNGQAYVSMINVVPWDCDVDVEMSTPTKWQVIGRAETSSERSLVQSTSGTRARITVPSGQLVVVRSVEPSANSLRSWTTRVSGGPEAIESIKHKVTQIVERVGILSDLKSAPGLLNGGFEQTGGMGVIGWLHAQHPPGCVQVDDKEFSEGTRSVMLTTSTQATTRTWLVSETIPMPDSGRLAVSLACRAEIKADEPPHQVRVSIEAIRQGEPIRFGRDLQVPRDGKWIQREVVLEVDELDSSSITSLRLTIDSLSAGRVWIDDVQLHDFFTTSQERSDLQTQVFLAVQGLQRGNLLPSGKLLQNHWARHLLTLGPNDQTQSVIETVPVPSDPPGVAERIRNWLPQPLRF